MPYNGLISSICDFCHIVAGPGVTLTFKYDVNKIIRYEQDGVLTDLFGSTGGPVSVDYEATYVDNGTTVPFGGNVYLKNCTSVYYGYYPQITGTNNYSIKSASLGDLDAAVVIIGIPFPDPKINPPKPLNYLDWDGKECTADKVHKSSYWGCINEDQEKCCDNNVNSWTGNCLYDQTPCGVRDPKNLVVPAPNKASLPATGGYYYA